MYRNKDRSRHAGRSHAARLPLVVAVLALLPFVGLDVGASQAVTLEAVPATDGRSVALSWTHPNNNGFNGVTGYQVLRGPSAGELSEIAFVGSTVRAFDDVNVTPTATYVYQVAAANGNSPPGPYSNKVTVTLPAAIPGAPTGLVARTGGTPGSVDLSWQDPDDDGGAEITGYELHRGLSADALEYVATLDVAGLGGVPPQRNHTDSGLETDTVYHFAVRAVNAAGASEPSNTAFAGTHTTVVPEPLPTPLTQTAAAFDGSHGYIFGGLTDPDEGTSTDAIIRFDPTTGETVEIAPNMTSARHGNSAAFVPGDGPSGSIIVALGSHVGNETPEASGVGPDSCHPACFDGLQLGRFNLGSQQMSLVPIEDPDLAARTLTSSVFDPVTASVYLFGGAPLAGEPEEVGGQSCHPACAVGGQIIKFDPFPQEAQSQSAVTVIPFPDDIAGRSATSAVYVPEEHDASGQPVPGTGVVYVFGGALEEHAHGGIEPMSCHPACRVGTEILLFEPQSQQMSVAPTQLPLELSHTSATFDGDAIYLFGGYARDAEENVTLPSDAVIRFDPRSGDVAVIGSLLQENAATSAIGTPLGMFVFGGDDAENSTDLVQRFDPDAPQNVTAVGGPAAEEVTVSWTPPHEAALGDVIGYRVYAAPQDGNHTLVAQLDADARSFTLTEDPATGGPLGNGTTWSLKVSALTAVSEGPQSAPVTATTFDVASAPRNLTAETDIGSGTITLEWDAPADDGGTAITEYVVYRTVNLLGKRQTTEIATGSTATRYVDDDCPYGTVCEYRVAARNLVGLGPRSSPVAAGVGLPP